MTSAQVTFHPTDHARETLVEELMRLYAFQGCDARQKLLAMPLAHLVALRDAVFEDMDARAAACLKELERFL